jgi:hypothetical protein
VRIEERRILARENAELALRVHEAGVITEEQFQRFWMAGHVGLYGNDHHPGAGPQGAQVGS